MTSKPATSLRRPQYRLDLHNENRTSPTAEPSAGQIEKRGSVSLTRGRRRLHFGTNSRRHGQRFSTISGALDLKATERA